MNRRAHPSMVEVTVKLVHSTKKAVLVNHKHKDHWLPRSRIRIEPNKSGTYTVRMKQRFASDRGMI